MTKTFRAPDPQSDSRPDPVADGSGLALPHERDESVGDAASEPDPVIVQAAKDIASGMVDTDMRSTGGLTQGRRDKLLDPSRKASPRRSHLDRRR